jgi:hypothetical protein
MQRFVRKQKQTCLLLTLFSFTARFEGWRRYHVEASESNINPKSEKQAFKFVCEAEICLEGFAC